MRIAVLTVVFLFAALGVWGATPIRAQATDITGVWLANGVSYAPWVFDLKQSGTTLTGTARQSGAVLTVAPVTEGIVNGNELSFKLTGGAGGTGGTITFKGTRNGETISFTRTAANSGTVGDGLFGAAGATTLTASRMPPGSTPPTQPASRIATAATATNRTATTTALLEGDRFVAIAGIAFAPWTFGLKFENGAVTGSVTQGNSDPASGYTTTVIGPYPVFDGKAEGNKISFKIKSSDGGKIATFDGVRTGDTIAFTRSLEIIQGDPGRDGILGASGAKQFSATLNAVFVPTSVAAVRLAATPNASTATVLGERWQVTGVQNAPWIFDFTRSGTALNGTISQNGSPAGTVTIAGGKVEGTVVSFKVLSPDAERVIAFTGRINGNEMSVVREISPLAGGSRGGNDLYGGLAPLQFIASRVAGTAAVAANRPTPVVFAFKGMSVDVSSIQSLPNRDAIIESLRGQINIIDAAITDPALKTFVESVPLVMAANLSGTDNAAYSSATRSVLLTTPSYSPEKPVVLHELMHAFHDQRISGGFGNPEIQQFYQQAMRSGKFPAGSYMLSNVSEYFAMMSSVYLHGSAARDPNTRQEIKDKQPDFFQWLAKEFGPR